MRDIKSAIYDTCTNYYILNQKRPTIIIGKETMKELNNTYIKSITDKSPELEGIVSNFIGYDVEEGNFDFGFYLK
jgi:hypothetical protein